MSNTTEYNIPYYIQELSDLFNNNDIDVNDKYVELYRILNEILAEGTSRNKIEFASSFARFTYIAQQKDISHELTQRINGLRARCKNLCNYESNELSRSFPFDIKSVLEFLSILNDKELDSWGKKENARLLGHIIGKLPAGNLLSKRNETKKNCIRVSVESWDDTYIYAITDDEEQSEKIKICHNDDNNYLGNWSYIAQLLKLDALNGKEKGQQLNIINAHFDKGVHYPEIIIYQPDFLIDISSIAKCFEQYGASPYLHLLNKIKESIPSKAMLLGNFAGQLLDEEINARGKDHEYAESVMTFFKRNAMNIVACKDDMSSFHEEAKNQQRNIKEIIKTACEEDKMLDLNKVLLEPSFFCETLGIQGRMDLLHSDYKVLMEQKSGKKDSHTGGHQEQHYVQVLLYMALLHYSFHLRNDEISCFLLYSKYENGLIKEGPAPKVLFEALRIRNQITYNEFMCANGGIDILDKLTPEHLNIHKRFDNFWLKYKLPEIQSVLTPIKCASELERTYFYRMFQFIQKENVLAKCGTANREGSGMAAIWNCTLEEKKLAGNIFDNLKISNYGKIVEDSKGEGISEIALNIPSAEDEYLPNFRIGDIVILYKYKKNETPDARRGMVFRTSIKTVKDNKITLKMRAPQKNADAFRQEDDTIWAIEHDYMESSFSTLYRALFSFLVANKDRRELILGQRKPKVNTSVSLHNDYSMGGKSTIFNELVLKAMQAEDYFIVIGPPGTGKTSFGMLNILKETLHNPQNTALLLSYTNRAVDEICSKLLKEGIDFIRIGSELSCPDTYKDHLLENKVAQCANTSMIRNVLMTQRVFVGTTTSLSSQQEIFALRHFSLAIIDEASQILEPHLMGILTAKHNERDAIDKFVFIGDHKQLPAVVQQSEEESIVNDEALNAIGLTDCRHSLFERLLRLQNGDTTFVSRLNRQGRMHEEVAQFPRECFYENNLRTIPMKHQHSALKYQHHTTDKYEQILSTHRLAFINVERQTQASSLKVNTSEAKVIAQIAYAVWNLYVQNHLTFVTDSTIGIIVPYRHQIATIRKEIATYGITALHDITIDTVERYQGSERDIIIYGFTIQRPFQLDFLTNNTFEENGKTIDRKLNVALTRAREQMILVGNAELLSQNPLFKKLIEQTSVFQ